MPVLVWSPVILYRLLLRSLLMLADCFVLSVLFVQGDVSLS